MASKRLSVSTSDKQIPVVSFANGTVKPSRKRKLTLTALQDGGHKGSSRRRKLMVVESEKMAYKGDNYGPLADREQSTQMFVARVNRMTGEVTLFPSERFQLHPVTQVDLQREQLVMESMSYSEKNDLLTDAFGSRKGKRAVVRRQKSRVVKDTVTSAMGSALDNALASHTPMPAVDSQETSSAIPPYNKDAQTPAEVYSLSDIVGPAEIDALANNAEVLKNCTALTLRAWTERKEYAGSVLGRLACLPMDEGQRRERACLLLYLHYMITFFHLKSDQIRKRDPLPQEWPEPIKRMMLDRFTVKVDGKAKRCIPQRVKDLLLSHILVLCLIADGFTTPLTHLMPDLKVSVTRLHNHVRALGCRVKVDSSAKDASGAKVSPSVAVLSVPLTFPEPFKKRQKN